MNIHGPIKIMFFKILVFSIVLYSITTNFSCNAMLEVNRDESLEMVEKLDNHFPYSDRDEHGIHKLDEIQEETWTMVQKKGKQFVLNEKPFYVNGFNTYYLMESAVDNSTRGKVSEIFKQASSVGLTVCRTWAFNDGQGRALQKSPSVYDEVVFEALDFVVSEAKNYKIRLILSLVNNWEDYGGKAQYVKWGKNVGLNLTSNDDFFNNPTLKDYYMSHVKAVLNRVNTFTNITYKDDPTIFAWELMNEPRSDSDPSRDKIQAWIEEMAVYLKIMDRKHMVEIGLEGFYGPSTPDRVQFNPSTYYEKAGTDFVRNHQVLGVDFASVHIYPDLWISNSTLETHIQFVKSWMEAHIEDADNILGMPVIFSEFGLSAKGQGSIYTDTMIVTVYNAIFSSSIQGGSAAGSLFWQLCVEGMYDGCGLVLSKSPSATGLVSFQSQWLNKLNSLCTSKCHWVCQGDER